MPRVHGPKDGHILTAKFNGKDAQNLKGIHDIQSLVLLSIRGKEHCTGKYLGAIIERALAGPTKPDPLSADKLYNAKTKKRQSKSDEESEKDNASEMDTQSKEFTTFLVADKVSWHNLKPMTADLAADEKAELERQALALGDDYLQENLTQFLLPFHLTIHEFERLYELVRNAPGEGANNVLNKLNLTTQQFTALRQAIKPEYSPIDAKIAVINQLAIEKGKHFKIVRWQEWINSDADFVENQQELIECYKQDALKSKIEEDAQDFAKRHKKEGGFDLWLHRSRGYLTEESPAVIWLSAKKGINCIIYPGEKLACFQATADFFIAHPSDPVKPLQIQVDKPELLVNWLDAYFTQSYSREQRIAMLMGDSDPASIDSPIESEEQATSFSVKRSYHSFFSPDEKRKFQSLSKHKPTGILPDIVIRPLSNGGMEPEDAQMSAVKKEVEILLAKIMSLREPEMQKQAFNLVETALEKAAFQLENNPDNPEISDATHFSHKV
ncbi:hypothetical protein [Legionella sp.]|uniref:hypothetical protein n=1 Tax=Legionella sp. TaxID=459 RepID=UPI00321FD3B7